MDIYSLRGQDSKQKVKEIKQDLISVVDADKLEERRADLEQLLYDLNIEVNRLAGSKEKFFHQQYHRDSTTKDRSTYCRLEPLELPDLLGAIGQRYP